MGFERRYANGVPGREDLAVSLAHAHDLEFERAREVLRRAAQAAAEDPQTRPVRQWFAHFVEQLGTLDGVPCSAERLFDVGLEVNQAGSAH